MSGSYNVGTYSVNGNGTYNQNGNLIGMGGAGGSIGSIGSSGNTTTSGTGGAGTGIPPMAVLPLPSAGNLPPFLLFFANPQGSAYNPISPELLQTSQAMLGETINSGLASVNANGSNMFTTIASLFNIWGQNINKALVNTGTQFQTATNKSAVACNGLFGCIFSGL